MAGELIPLWIKVLYTLFLCVLVPVYWVRWGPRNFLWFSDIALLITGVALWLESALLASMMTLAIALPELAWNADFFGRLLSGAIKSIAAYEGKTEPIIEEELGSQLHLAGKTIQRYKAGHLPPEVRTVGILAEAAVQRGYLGREWLQRFLHTTRYPFADQLLDRLCPIGPARQS